VSKEQSSELVAKDCRNCSRDVKLGIERVRYDPKETIERASAMALNAPNLY